jgi:crotonobetainyl-CoA:carnitine CoA-transferase CaiB-like acyl-CoA transferase
MSSSGGNDLTERLLADVRVIDLGGEACQMAGRVLADLGADVVKVEPASGDPMRQSPPLDGANGRSLRGWVWSIGKQVATMRVDGTGVEHLLAGADLVLASSPEGSDSDAATHASWITVTPFGLTGPMARWRGSDLTCAAASGHLFATGDPDRPPVRCTEPLAYAQAAGEVALAALTALASGTPQQVDVSIAEAMTAANMSAHVSMFQHGDRGTRSGGSMGRTREVWRCRDGFIVFGMRGGPSRARTWDAVVARLTAEGIDPGPFAGIEWSKFRHDSASDAELERMAESLALYFARHTMEELYELALSDKLLIAPVMSPVEMYVHPQLRSVSFFRPIAPYGNVPYSFARAHRLGSGDADQELIGPHPPAPGSGVAWSRRAVPATIPRQPWAGLRLLEFGSGVAAPMTTRYFVEYGATCIHVESTSRPDVIRLYSTHPLDPSLAPFEGSVLFANVNAGKHSVTLNMKRPEARDLALRLVDWADALVENYAPATLPRWGLGTEELARRRPDLVVLRSSMWGSHGPHADYPGYGPQGTALSGYLFLTGWPDRDPAFPYGTVTDTVAPRYSAAALAAALLYRRRTGHGVIVDVSQIEVALFTLSPWLLDYAVNGRVGERAGNRSSLGAVPHGVFPTLGADRWIAIAIWTDEEWAQLCRIMGMPATPFPTNEERTAAVSEVEALVGGWTAGREGQELAELLQSKDIEACPVQDFADVVNDPQLRSRDHFVVLDHPVIGRHRYERSSFRMNASTGTIASPGPTLGQHTDSVLREILGLTEAELGQLRSAGVLD